MAVPMVVEVVVRVDWQLAGAEVVATQRNVCNTRPQTPHRYLL